MLIELEFLYITISVHAQQDTSISAQQNLWCKDELTVKLASDIPQTAAFREDVHFSPIKSVLSLKTKVK